MSMHHWRRRSVMIAVAGVASGSALGVLGDSTNDSQQSLWGGTMALNEAYNPAGDLWIGPDTAKGNIPAEKGRLYIATDLQVEYYGDGGSWELLGVGSDSKAVPEVHGDLVETQEVLVEDTA